MKTEEELIDQYFKEKSQTDITQLEFAQKHNINPYTFLRWLQKDPRYQRTYVKYTTEERENKVDKFFKLNQETGISVTKFANKHNINPTTFNKWLHNDYRYQRNKVRYTRETYTKEERKNKVDEFFKLNQETGISLTKFADKHNIIPTTFNKWLLKDHRYKRTRTEFTKEPTLDTSVKQVLDEQKEKNAETVYGIGTLINDYLDSPISSDDLDQYLQPSNDQSSTSNTLTRKNINLDEVDLPSNSRMTPDISWYSSEENLSMIEESLAVVDQPSTSNQTNLKNKIKNAKITANQSNRNHPYNKTNLDRAFR